MKNREKRRYLTEKYRQRQVRLAYRSYGNKRPYDPNRYLQRPLAKKKRFLDELMGNYVGPEWTDHQRYSHTQWMLGNPREFTAQQLGRFRRHSFNMCPWPRCPHCSNPRKGYGFEHGDEMLTLQERVAKHKHHEDLALFHAGEYDDLLSH